ncbi:MAG: hypothetical protein KTR27_20325 [Leptolyngbyaceae cyanobacterium MAG.088]|nr:hypothetical protein [Leptolyngbyaceae cyanobacterium MAG.088]
MNVQPFLLGLSWACLWLWRLKACFVRLVINGVIEVYLPMETRTYTVMAHDQLGFLY